MNKMFIWLFGRPYLSVLSQEDRQFFLDSVNEDIKNNHIVSNINAYELMVNEFIKNGPFQSSTDRENIALVYMYVLKRRNKIIGCSMIYKFNDYVEFMYIHISKEFRRRNYGSLFQAKLENLISPNTRMHIRCLAESTDGSMLASKMGYKLISVSQSGTRTFEKVKL